MPTAPQADATSRRDATARRDKELRLALVLYGGVSLAIYMHGTTKEIHRLVRASQRLGEDEGGLTPSERVYRDLLEDKAEQEGVTTRVVVDIVAGTSAGGINGIYLAKALAHDLSQDALRDLWLERGDVDQLVRGWKQLPWKVRLLWVVPTLFRKPALDGDRMSLWLFDALQGMDAGRRGGNGRSLMPPGHRLRLFVTATDFYGYERQLMIKDPPMILDRRHRHVLQFRYEDGRTDFGDDDLSNAALAYAARATSCFPGAFPPVSPEAFQGYLRRLKGLRVDLSALEERPRLFRHYPLARARSYRRPFVDGGVLDNRPFEHAVAAIRQQPAGLEVERRLLYLEPDPKTPGRGPTQTETTPEPSPIATILSTVAGLPRTEPILDEILAVNERNEQVEAVQHVIRTSWSRVSELVEAELPDLASPPENPDDSDLKAWQGNVHQLAVDETGLAYTTYVRAKTSGVVDGWASTICRLLRFPHDCNQAAFVRAAVRTWAAQAGLFQEQEPRPTKTQLDFLRTFDLDYGQRRLRFVIAGLSWWYDPDTEDFPLPDRREIDAGKARLYEAVEALGAAKRGQDLPAKLARQVGEIFGEAALEDHLYGDGPRIDRFLEDARERLGELMQMFTAHLEERFSGFARGIYEDVRRLTADWHPEARRRLLLRYLSFPVWDAMLFPLESLSGIGERDRVDVVRLSPLDVELIPAPDRPKLEGVRHHHFGAFFSRPGREKDYLWGRLDGAERLIGLLVGDAPEREAWCRRAFAAILEEEAGLREAGELVRHVRRTLEMSSPSAPEAG